MRTDTVIVIVGAHGARNAASRLTMPVSDETAGPGSWPGSSGDPMNASGVPAAGWPVLTRDDTSDGHPATEQWPGRRGRFGLRAPAGAGQWASAIAGVLDRGYRQLTPALLGVG
jgi:hypothetical protein